ERVFQEAARAMLDGAVKTAAGLFSIVRDVYIEDARFEQDFARLELKSGGSFKKLVRYVLARLETDACGRHCDPESDPGTVEHVLPEHPSDDWETCIPRSHWPRLAHRLGNLCLLEASLNRRVGNASYPDKLKAYAESQYTLTRTIADEAPEAWSIATIEARQARLARRAVHIWRLDY
ncbi:MAG: HNH endonuclease family protein, partial [Candidatus Xenobia bacterium]